MITVDMLNHPNTLSTFHTSQALQFFENDNELFPGCKLEMLTLIIVDSQEEYTINRILKVARACNIWYNGMAMAQKKTIGYWVKNSTIVKCWTFGWLKRMGFPLGSSFTFLH